MFSAAPKSTLNDFLATWVMRIFAVLGAIVVVAAVGALTALTLKGIYDYTVWQWSHESVHASDGENPESPCSAIESRPPQNIPDGTALLDERGDLFQDEVEAGGGQQE